MAPTLAPLVCQRAHALRLVLALLVALVGFAPDLARAGDTQPAPGEVSDRGDTGIQVVMADGTRVGFPLKDLEIRADIVGDMSAVTVVQTYENPLDERVEAVYTFPLPEDAAVHEMVMVIGERRVRAEIKEREEARRTYEEARDEGRTAALLDQERPNVFTQTVANIEPGQPIQVLISYVEQVPFEDGRYHVAMPLVVGPRYIGGQPLAAATGQSGSGALADTGRVPDASRITPPVLPADQSVPYEVDLEVTLSAGAPLHDIDSTTHDLVVDWTDEHRAVLTLPADQRRPDRDIVFSYGLGAAVPAISVSSHHDDRGGFFSMTVLPPTAIEPDAVRPREIVFVLDTSGSMSGQPLEATQRLMHHALAGLRPGDAFRLVRFADDVGELAHVPLAPTDENLELGRAWIDGLVASGGTELAAGVDAALTPEVSDDHLRMVFFLTDGYIGDEASVLEMISARIGEARIYTVGVGSSTNRYLLDEMALLGRGTATFIDTDDDVADTVARLFHRIDSPVFTDIEIDWGELDVHGVSPDPVRDVFAGMPLVITGRYDEASSGEVVVRGLHGTTPTELVFDVELGRDADHPAIPIVWARRRIAELERDSLADYGAEADALKADIVATGLEFSLMTRHTSFVAVDERIVANADDPLRTVQVAVDLPHGVDDTHIGAQLTPGYVQPGDPELLIQTDPGAIAVTAYFPFDLVQELTFDPVTERWATRFLVPRDLDDGRYTIAVLIEFDDGRVEELEIPFDVDASAPRLEAELVGLEATADAAPRVAVDDVLHIRATLLETPSVPADTAIGGAVLEDAIKFVRIHLPDGRQVHMSPSADDPSRYDFWFRHRDELGGGDFELTLEAVDVAGNATLTTLRYHVPTVGL